MNGALPYGTGPAPSRAEPATQSQAEPLIPSATERLAFTLEWCADWGRIEGLHPMEVRRAASLLREQARQIEEMRQTLAANTPTVLLDEREGFRPYTTARRFTFIAANPQAYQVETQHENFIGYPVEVEARRAVSMFVRLFEDALLPLTAQAIEARRAETGTGSVHESPVAEGDAP